MKTCAAAFAATLLAASPALADCAGSHALDRCLIGTWHYASGGSAEWMSRNIHMAHVTGITHNDLTITFRPDGTFATGHTDVHATIAANDGSMTGSGHAEGQASGAWSAGGGHFNFCMTPGSMRTTVTIVVHGRPMTVTPPMPTHPTATAYTCSGNMLTTTQPIPGHEPIVTIYRH
ncbi:MAG TPA: hypothetical protein VHZ78_02505 [Rhizomicrobium sp.]|nr:hypothetical protein [Rhizomicrobium sp.]